MKYKRIFWMLVHAGHDGQKAAEIILNAARGDRYSIDWIKCIRKVQS